MNWWRGLDIPVESDVPLAPRTRFRLGGSARWMARPDGCAPLSALLRRVADEALRSRVLGGGANVLVRDDGFDGVIIRLDAPAFGSLRFGDDHIEVGGGFDMPELVRLCARRGLSGLEGLAGIPGTIGGFIRMNAGGRYGCIGDVVASATVMDAFGRKERLASDVLGFGYRSSKVGAGIVVAAVLRVHRADPRKTMERYRGVFAEKTRAQPLAARSAGCVFKNPKGESAGALIDRTGLKGTVCRGASVSERHANFIVTSDGTRSADVLELIETVRTRVQAATGVALELEIDVW